MLTGGRAHRRGGGQDEADRVGGRRLVRFGASLLAQRALDHLSWPGATPEHGLTTCDLRHDLAVGQVDQCPAGVEDA